MMQPVMKSMPTMATTVAATPTFRPGTSPNSATVRAFVNAVSVAAARTP